MFGMGDNGWVWHCKSYTGSSDLYTADIGIVGGQCKQW